MLVCSARVGGFGLNLHKACSDGVVLELPASYQALVQAFGRLYRADAPAVQRWEILTIT